MKKTFLFLLVGCALGAGGIWFWFTQSVDNTLAQVETLSREAQTKLKMQQRAATANFKATASASLTKLGIPVQTGNTSHQSQTASTDKLSKLDLNAPTAATASPTTGGIRRCTINGRVVYSDLDCNNAPNSRDVTIHDTKGYDAAAIAAQSERTLAALGGSPKTSSTADLPGEGTGESVKELLMPNNEPVCKYIKGETHRLDTWEKFALLPSMKNWVTQQRSRFNDQLHKNSC